MTSSAILLNPERTSIFAWVFPAFLISAIQTSLNFNGSVSMQTQKWMNNLTSSAFSTKISVNSLIWVAPNAGFWYMWIIEQAFKDQARKAKAMGMANQLTMIFRYKEQESVKITEEW